MNIVVIGNFKNPSWDGSICDEIHIADALENMGHYVERIERTYDLQFINHHFGGWDFILLAQWDGYPDTLIGNGKEMSMMSSWRTNFPVTSHGKVPKIVYWAFDYQADGQEWHEKLVAEADLYLSKRLADSRYANWQWLSQDFSPEFLFEVSGEVEKDIDVLFTGSYLPWATERNETLKAIDDKFNLVIHSVNSWEGFKDVRPPVMDDGLPELYARSKIIISIDHTLEAGYWSDRNAQIMCCGGFVLFRYIPLSETVFRDNIAYFYSIEDCLEKIELYLNDENARVAVSGGGYSYAQKYLKVKNRVKDLLTIVESI